jgi:peroxiredoxin
VSLGGPRQYQAVPEQTLGTNENWKGLPLGQKIDSVEIADIDGEPYQIRQAWSEKPALVIFYRGGWCPFCNFQLRELAKEHDQLKAAGLQVVAISADMADKAATTHAQFDIPFPVLSDPKLIAHDWSGQEHNKVAVASAFIVDQQGRVLFSHAPIDYATRPSIDQLLSVTGLSLPDQRA